MEDEVHEMPGFADRVIAASESKDSVLVVGLDPNVDYFPNVLAPTQESGRAVTQAISQFNRMVIDAVADYAVAVKPRLAYYEIYGADGPMISRGTFTRRGRVSSHPHRAVLPIGIAR